MEDKVKAVLEGLNEEQRMAVECVDGPVLIVAGAGSGKTRVLTERLMAYILDESCPADIDSFLIITYTRAAAGELRGRIMEELSKKLAEDPGNRHLRKQSALCAKAQIGTIHSFCADLLRENCHLAGLSPDFRVLDEDRASAMKAAALDRVLEQRYEKSDKYPGFILLADTVGQGRDDKALSAARECLSGTRTLPGYVLYMKREDSGECWSSDGFFKQQGDYQFFVNM